MKTCPNCGLINPNTSISCDCGYNFNTETQQKPIEESEYSNQKMSLSQLLFSFDGRINRAKYWLTGLALSPIWITGLMIDLATIGEAGPFYYLSALLLMWPGIAINVKRCHDRDKSGWFYLIVFVPIVSIWYLIEVGFLKGTTGNNRFGSNPLAGVE